MKKFDNTVNCLLYNSSSQYCALETYIIMKFPLAYSFQNVMSTTTSTLLSTVPIIRNQRDFLKNPARQSQKNKKELPNRSVKTPLFKFPSPHDFGFHHVLKPLRPSILAVLH